MKSGPRFLIAALTATWVPSAAQAACFPASTDSDGDGYCTNSLIARDCDDSTSAISPDDQEVIGNLADEDCDGHDALNRRMLAAAFPAPLWTGTGTVTRPPTNETIKLGNGSSGAHASRTFSQTIAQGKVWLIADVNAFTGGGFGAKCTIAVSTKPYPGGGTTTVTSNVFSSGTKLFGPLSVTSPARILTKIELDCPAGPTMTVDWLSVQNTDDAFPPAKDVLVDWADVDAPGGGLTTTVVTRSLDPAFDLYGSLYAGSDVGGVATKDPWKSAEPPWRTINGDAPDALTSQPSMGVADILATSWGEIFSLSGRVSSGSLSGGLWMSDDDGDTWTELANTVDDAIGGYAKYSECGNVAHGGGKLLVPEPGIETIYIGSGDEDALGVALWDWDDTVCELPNTGTTLPEGYIGALARVESASNGIPGLLVGYRGRGASEESLYLCELPLDATDLDADSDTSEVGLSCSVGAASCEPVTDATGLDIRDLEVDALVNSVVYVADGGDDPEASSCASNCGGVYGLTIDDSGGSLTASLSAELSAGAFECTAGADYLDVTGVSMDPDGDVLLAFAPTTHDKGYTYDRIYRILAGDIGSGMASDWVELNEDTNADRLARQGALDLSGGWLEATSVVKETPYPEYHAPGNAYDAIWYDGYTAPATGDWYAAVMTEFQVWKVEGLDDTTVGWDGEDDTTWTFWPEPTVTHSRAWQTTVVNDVAADEEGNLWMPVSDLGLFELPVGEPAAELDCLWDFYNAGGSRVSIGLDDSVWVSFFDQGSDAIPHEMGIFRTLDGGGTWEYQGAGITNSGARDAASNYKPWCKDFDTTHEASAFGGSSGFVFNELESTSALLESWGNPIALAAVNSAAVVAGFQSYSYTGGTITVDGRLAYSIDGAGSWTEISFDGDWAGDGVTTDDCVAYDFYGKLKGVALVHPGDDSYTYADDANLDGMISGAEGWAFDLFVGSRDADADAGRDGRCALARVRVDTSGATWEWFDLSDPALDCDVDEENMRVVATSPWSDEVYVGGFYTYNGGVHEGGVCAIDIDDATAASIVVDPSVWQVSIGDIAPHPNVSDLMLVAPLLDAEAWSQCMETGAGSCPDVPYPLLLEQASGTWTVTSLTNDAPPSMVATAAGWTTLIDSETAILYGTEGSGAWVGSLSW